MSKGVYMTLFVSLLIIFSVAAFFLGRLSHSWKPSIHILERDLPIGTSAVAKPYAIPKGTTLYYDGSMPEGFDRYYLYVNVEGGPLPLTKAPKAFLKVPLSGVLGRDEMVR